MKRKVWIPVLLLVAIALSAIAGRLGSTSATAREAEEGIRSEKKQAKGVKTYTLENCVSEFSQDAVKKTKQGWQFWFVPTSLSPTFNFKVSQVGPQSANHPSHTHAEEEIFYVFEGTAEFSLNGKKKTVGPNSTLFCPSDVPHGIRNAGDSVMRYAVIKANYPVKK